VENKKKWGTFFETEGGTNDHEFKLTVESSQPRGRPSGPTSGALPNTAAVPTPSTAPSRYAHPLHVGALLYNCREAGVELLTPTLHFSLPPTLTFSITCKNILHKA
jgi:hypothetical protein